MTPEEWCERGRRDYRQGVPRAGAPSGGETDAGREWRAGWDEAAAEGESERAAVYETLDVHLEFRAGRLMLTDSKGRVIGTQTGLIVEQGEDTVASVTFAGLKIVTS